MTFILLSPREIIQEFAARARTLRLAANLGQRELAAKAGVSFGTVRRFERGETISLENFIRILETLGRAGELSALLAPETSLSIAKLERLEKAKRRRRASPQRS